MSSQARIDAGLGVRFELTPLRPMISPVVVVDVAKQQAGIGPVYDQSNVRVHADRPETLVFGPVQLVQLQTRMGGIQLQVKGRCLDGLLFVSRQFGQTIGKGVGDAEFHSISQFTPVEPGKRPQFPS